MLISVVLSLVVFSLQTAASNEKTVLADSNLESFSYNQIDMSGVSKIIIKGEIKKKYDPKSVESALQMKFAQELSGLVVKKLENVLREALKITEELFQVVDNKSFENHKSLLPTIIAKCEFLSEELTKVVLFSLPVAQLSPSATILAAASTAANTSVQKINPEHTGFEISNSPSKVSFVDFTADNEIMKSFEAIIKLNNFAFVDLDFCRFDIKSFDNVTFGDNVKEVSVCNYNLNGNFSNFLESLPKNIDVLSCHYKQLPIDNIVISVNSFKKFTHLVIKVNDQDMTENLKETIKNDPDKNAVTLNFSQITIPNAELQKKKEKKKLSRLFYRSSQKKSSTLPSSPI